MHSCQILGSLITTPTEGCLRQTSRQLINDARTSLRLILLSKVETVSPFTFVVAGSSTLRGLHQAPVNSMTKRIVVYLFRIHRALNVARFSRLAVVAVVQAIAIPSCQPSLDLLHVLHDIPLWIWHLVQLRLIIFIR